MSDHFRWQALFQKSTDPIFALGQRRQLVFANAAWEALTGRCFADVRGVAFTRRKTGEDHAGLASTLSPPPEVLEGKSARVQRPPPGRKSGPPWWDVDFLPIEGESGLIGIVGRIRAETTTASVAADLTEPQVELRNAVAARHRLESLDGRFPSLSTALSQARLAAAYRSPVTIIGEPGVGKVWLARAIHCAGRFRDRPFLTLDAAALPAMAIAGVLFGPLGLYRSDGASTIYIHEPARLAVDVQDELAQRLAGGADADARLIVGSSADLTSASANLLPALATALAILTIRLPPLRERTDEFPAIASMALERLSDTPTAIAPEASECLAAYSWPGNFDELLDAISEALARAGGGQIELAHLPLAVRQAKVAADLRSPAEPPFPELDKTLEAEERRLIRLALENAKGNQTKAAQLLSIWRPRLIRRMKALGIEPK